MDNIESSKNSNSVQIWTMLKVAVILFTAVCYDTTDAVAPCDPNIISQLSKIKECYEEGHVPNLLASGVLGTHVRISRGELPQNTKCVTAIQHDGVADVTIFLQNGSKVPFTNKQEPKDGYLLETDGKGVKYRLYVIHNESHVYSYYRCLDGNSGGTGSPMGDVAVGCKFVNDQTSNAVITRADTCFWKLGIKNIVRLSPCIC